MAKIVQKYKECIGCGTCVVLCPKFWEMVEEDGCCKAKLMGGKLNPESEEYEIELKDEEDIACNSNLVEMCPVQIIRVV